MSFGKYNKNYKYVFLSGFFMTLKYYLPTFLTEIFIFKKKINDYTIYLYNHSHILDIFRFFGMILFSFFFYIFEKKYFKSESNTEKSNALISEKGCFEAIKNDDKRLQKINKKKNILNFLVIIVVCLILECISDIFNTISIFTFWLGILLIISYINSKVFNSVTYKHQKLAIYFCFCTGFIFQLSSFIIVMNTGTDEDSIYKKILWFLPIGLIIYFMDVGIISYAYSKMKWFLDSKWISLSKLFMIYSIIGFFINIIFCVIANFIKCRGEVASFFCRIQDSKGNFYIDNISEFLDDISNIGGENGQYLIYNIIILLSDIILNSLFIYFYFLVVKNLNPEFFFL